MSIPEPRDEESERARAGAAREIDRLRERIDDLDAQLVDLLNRRTELALAIGRVKREHGLAVYCPERESAIFERICSLGTGPLAPAALRRLFERILDESRGVQRSLAAADPPVTAQATRGT